MKQLGAHAVREVAVEAGVDPRTVKRFIETGAEGMNSTTASRVTRALVKLGHMTETEAK